MTKRRPYLIGNWKMYKTIEEAVNFFKELAPRIQEVENDVGLAVPFTAICAVCEAVKDTKILIGAQNMNDATEGAFTGEIAGRMLKEAGAQFVLLGHSERRQLFQESSAYINQKVKRALLDGLLPVLCVGETLQERNEKLAEKVIENQLLESLNGVTPKEVEQILIAYEPVWAIGTGVAATPLQAEEMHHFCRTVIEKKWGKPISENVRILYGGSVKPDNVALLMKEDNIDGALVGGASLSPESFYQIIKNLP